MNDGDRFLTVGEVSKRLNVARSTVFYWAKKGVMPRQIKLGRTSRWSSMELEAWLKERPRGAYGEAKKA